MKKDAIPTRRLHLAIVLLSAALIAFQLEQMQLLAFVQWHHFAYLVISVALLGFGASGTLIALCQTSLLRFVDWLLPLLMFACAGVMAMALPISASLINAFDISLLFVEPSQAILLLAGQAVYLLIFFLGALPLGLVFIHFNNRIGSLYSANLLGSGIGAITAVTLMYILLPHELPGFISLLTWIAGLLVMQRNRPILFMAAGLSLILVVSVIVAPPIIRPSQYKAISRTLDLPGAQVIISKPSPYGLVEFVSAPSLRYAPGLSLTYTKEVPELHGAIFINGDWFGAVEDKDQKLFRSSAAFLPYDLGKRNQVLVLLAGTGIDVMRALQNGGSKIVAVEPHQRAVEILFSDKDNGMKNHFYNPAVDLVYLFPRTWLAMDRNRYDLITLPMIGRFGGTSGLFALQEEYLLTEEAFLELWNHLAPDGILRVSVWLDSPARNSLRLAATLAEAMDKVGVDFKSHVSAVRGWDMITFVVKRSPFTPEDVGKINAFCKQMQFDPLLLAGHEFQEFQQYHYSTDQPITHHLKTLLTETGRQVLYREYDFNIKPVTDNRPFFSQFIRWQSVHHLVRLLGQHTFPFLELGYILVIIGFLQMVLASGAIILLPLLQLGLPGRKKVQKWVIPFFSGLGTGYMFFEIYMIHELVFFLGHPIIAVAAVISSLLIFSGLGSLFSSRLSNHQRHHAMAAGVVAMILLVYLFILQPLLHQTIGLPIYWKIIVFLVLTAIPAFVMGMPFPLGLARLAGLSKNQAAWAWGINGCVSVVSTGLATIIAVEFGFSTVMLISCGAYCVAALSGYLSWRSLNGVNIS